VYTHAKIECIIDSLTLKSIVRYFKLAFSVTRVIHLLALTLGLPRMQARYIGLIMRVCKYVVQYCFMPTKYYTICC